MAGYRKMTKGDKDIFLSLYKKYITEEDDGNTGKVDHVSKILENLPTDVINRIFDGKEFFGKGYTVDQIENATFGFCGMCGWGVVKRTANDLEYYYNLLEDGRLVSTLANVGHKVNMKNIGIAS